MRERFLTRENIDSHFWDACVSSSPNESPYAYSWYLDVACPDWAGLVLGDYEAVFPLPIKRKMGLFYLLQPLFIPTLDVYSKKEEGSLKIDGLFSKIPHDLRYIDINLTHKIKTSSSFSHSLYFNQEIDLTQSYTDIRSNYSKTLAYDLSKVESELTFVRDIAVEDVVLMFEKSIGTRLKSFGAEEYRRLYCLLSLLVENEKGLAVGVKNKLGELIATAFVTESRGCLALMKASSTLLGKQNNAMSFLIDNLLSTYALQQSSKRFDFEGSSIEGVAQFNRKFGAQNIERYRVQKNSLPLLIRWLKGV